MFRGLVEFPQGLEKEMPALSLFEDFKHIPSQFLRTKRGIAREKKMTSRRCGIHKLWKAPAISG